MEAIGIHPRLIARLAALGLTTPTPVQRAVLPRLLPPAPLQPIGTTRPGWSVAIGAPTGSGKTLCFLLPIAQRLMDARHATVPLPAPDAATIHPLLSSAGLDEAPAISRPLALVLVPSIELATQTDRVARQLLHGLDVDVRLVVSAQAKNIATADVLIATPGVLTSFKYRRLLPAVQILALDEVDLLLKAGMQHDVRLVLNDLAHLHKLAFPARLVGTRQLQKVKQRSSDRDDPRVLPHFPLQVITTGATWPANMRNPVLTELTKLFPQMTSYRDDGLHRRVETLTETFVDGLDTFEAKVAHLWTYLRDVERGKTMIFVNSAKTAAQLHQTLSDRGLKCEGFYRMSDDASTDATATRVDRTKARVASIRRLLELPDGTQHTVIICTDLASRGIDIPDVERVVQFDFALSAIDYLHRIGRTARAGKPGQVLHMVGSAQAELANELRKSAHLPVDEHTPAPEQDTVEKLFSHKRSLRRKIKKAKAAATSKTSSVNT